MAEDIGINTKDCLSVEHDRYGSVKQEPPDDVGYCLPIEFDNNVDIEVKQEHIMEMKCSEVEHAVSSDVDDGNEQDDKVLRDAACSSLNKVESAPGSSQRREHKPYRERKGRKKFDKSSSDEALTNSDEKRTYYCDICTKKFLCVSKLNRHKLIHSGEKPFECDICMKKFNQQANLSMHKRVHSGEKVHECNVCKKKFSDSKTLNVHKRIHSGEKPFECEICMKKFSHSSTYTVHKRIHSGEKPFECDICMKKFTGSSSVNRHKKIHSGEKPHECNICMKKFTRALTLKFHKRKHNIE